MKQFDNLLSAITKADLLEDVEKSDKGNKAAQTRVRVAMQSIKKQAQEVRLAIQAMRK